MKKSLLRGFSLFIAVSNSKAQLITDTVSLGAGYANQQWYSLANDEQETSPKNN